MLKRTWEGICVREWYCVCDSLQNLQWFCNTLVISSALATSTLKRSECSPPSSIDDGSTTRPWVINRFATQHDADTAVTPRWGVRCLVHVIEIHMVCMLIQRNDIVHHSTLCLFACWQAVQLWQLFHLGMSQGPLGFNSTHWIYYCLFYTSYLKMVLDMVSFCLQRGIKSNKLVHFLSKFCCWCENITFSLLSFRLSLVQALLLFILNEGATIPDSLCCH